MRSTKTHARGPFARLATVRNVPVKALSFAAIVFFFALNAGGQTRPRYVYDNFSGGSMNVSVPAGQKPGKPLSATKNPGRPEKQLVKKTAQSKPVFAAGIDRQYNAGPLSSTLRGNSTGNPQFDRFIMESCARHGVDPLLIFAQMNQESSFKLRALSNKGASGLMQLMPATAARFGVTSIYDPQQNIEGGVKYMRWLLSTFNGDLSLALAGYNAGEGAVMKYGWEIPPYNETRDYVRRITARYKSLKGGGAVYTPRPDQAYASPLKPAQKPLPLPGIEAEKPRVTISRYETSVHAVKNKDGKVQLITY